MNINNNSNNKGSGKVDKDQKLAIGKKKTLNCQVDNMWTTSDHKGITKSNTQGEQTPSGKHALVHKQSTIINRYKISFPHDIHSLSTATRFDQIARGVL